MDKARRIAIAQGSEPVELLLKNAQLVNVFGGCIHSATIAVHEGTIIGFGDYEAHTTVDLEGRYVAPGFIDGHLHLESSMLSIPEFSRNVVPLGTTAVVADPHEIANVMGTEGVKYILDSSEGLPLRVFVMFPSCVPATPFETSGAELTSVDMEAFKDHPRVIGLAEVMNFPGLLAGDPGILAKMEVFKDKVIDGHAPGLSGKALCAYAGAGVGSDHECTTVEEAREKLQKGMTIMIREGSAAKNLSTLIPLVNDHNSRHCLLVTDDMEPEDIVKKGHLNSLVRTAIEKGVEPLRAIQMVTINTAAYFGLKGIGAVLPGYTADLVVLDDLRTVRINRVYSNGRLVAEGGRLLAPSVSQVESLPQRMNVDWNKVSDLSIPAQSDTVKVIQVIPGQIVTKKMVETARILNRHVVTDPDRDILKMAVIERHHGTGSFSLGLIRGFGLKRGAIAGTVAHDSHNIIVVGENDEDMLVAAKNAAAMGGGMTVAENGRVLASLPLPIAGLMSDRPIAEVCSGLEGIVGAAHSLGCRLENPFATLSFMALTPIPELKLTDQGLFDSVNFRFVSLFGE